MTNTHCISDMVALPLIDSRTSTSASSTLNLPCTTHKLVPRKGVTDAWFDEMNDLLAQRKLTQITHETRPPSVDDLAALLPGMPAHMLQAAHVAMSKEWWGESTALYHIVRASIDLSGVYEKKDLSMIKANYIIDGDNRNGPAFLKWVMSFTNIESVGEQSKLLSRILNAKLPQNPSQEQFGKHLADLLIDWMAVKGNDLRNPASFYHALLSSFPDSDAGKIGHLKAWLSDRISDDDPSLKDPSGFIDKFASRAANLGLPSNPGFINVTAASCDFCPSRLCKGAKNINQCLAFNASRKRPALAQDGQWSFVELLRAYVAAYPNVKSLKGMSVEKLQTGIKAAGKEVPTRPNKGGRSSLIWGG